jgi:cellulose synthase operon protein YhjQ
METQPLDTTEDRRNGETPEDVAILYSWANLEGAKYRDFSASRREYRAQMRHRAAEQLRLMELRAQSEAEAAAAQAEREAAAAHAEADAATVKLAASRAMPTAEQTEIQEEEVETKRRSSLREAAQQARKAAAERLEAARRAEAAALADSIARREEREIAEAQASALRQAAQYAEADARSRQKKATQPEVPVPGRISDPYGPQPLAEGEYFERPGTPVAELAASRFRQQREYIEQSTGVELPSFRVPAVSAEQGEEQAQRAREAERQPRDIPPRRMARGPSAKARPADDRLEPERAARVGTRPPVVDGSLLAYAPEEIPAELPPRPQPKPVYEDRYLSIARDPHRLDEAGAQTLRREYTKQVEPGPQGRVVIPSIPYKEFRRAAAGASAPPPRAAAEVVSQIPEMPQDSLRLTQVHSREGVPPYERAAGNGAPRWEPPTPNPVARPAANVTARPAIGDSAVPRTAPQWPTQQPSAPYLPSVQSSNVAASPVRPASAPPVQRSSDPAWLSSSSSQVSGQFSGQFRPAPALPGNSQPGAPVGDTLQHSREQVASRWYALKGLFSPNGDRNGAHAGVPANGLAGTQNGRDPAAGLQTSAEAHLNGDRHTAREKRRNTPLVVVFSLAGGVGKTSLVATLGRALSSLGEKVLLTDTTSHGLLPFYFGAKELHSGVVRTFSPPFGSVDAPIHLVSYDLETSSTRDREPGRQEHDPHESVVEDLLANSQRVHRVLIDLDADNAWMAGRLARFKPTVVVPLVADMNSVVSVRAIEKRFSGMQDAAGNRLQPVYLLNQFDASVPLHLDLREVLSQQLGDRLLPFVVRRAAGVSEALAEGMTILDYEPESGVVHDYLGVANWLRSASAPAGMGDRSPRWSERWSDR